MVPVVPMFLHIHARVLGLISEYVQCVYAAFGVRVFTVQTSLRPVTTTRRSIQLVFTTREFEKKNGARKSIFGKCLIDVEFKHHTINLKANNKATFMWCIKAHPKLVIPVMPLKHP